MMDKLFFTSDHHFFHSRILQYCPNRQFNSIEDHNEHLIKVWNEKVDTNDIIFHLGDFGFGSVEHLNLILNRLKGIKILISGNHDKKLINDSRFINCFSSHKHYDELVVTYKEERIPLIMFHYPLEDWDRKDQESIHLHGHIHSTFSNPKIPRIKNRQDIGVDSRIDHAPWEKDELISYLRNGLKIKEPLDI